LCTFRRALRALFRNGGGFGGGFCVRHRGDFPFGGRSTHHDSSLRRLGNPALFIPVKVG
jgi:hypothetical protein